MYFVEKDAGGKTIDYLAAVSGSLRLVPEGASRGALAEDFLAMREDGLLSSNTPGFDSIMETCADIEGKLNREGRRCEQAVNHRCRTEAAPVGTAVTRSFRLP